MPTKLVLRNGKLSLRADGRVEKTGDDGICPDCGCFACPCSNSINTTFGDYPIDGNHFDNPCPSSSFLVSGGTREFCLPAAIKIAVAANTGVNFEIQYPDIGRTVNVALPSMPAFEVAIPTNNISPLPGRKIPLWEGNGGPLCVPVRHRGTDIYGNAFDKTFYYCCEYNFYSCLVKRTDDPLKRIIEFEHVILVPVFFDAPRAAPALIFRVNRAVLTIDIDNNIFCKSGGSATFGPDMLSGSNPLVVTGSTLPQDYSPAGYSGAAITITSCVDTPAIQAVAPPGTCTRTVYVGDGIQCDSTPPVDPPKQHCWRRFSKLSGSAHASDSFTYDGSVVSVTPPSPFLAGVPKTVLEGSACRIVVYYDGGEINPGETCPVPVSPDDYPGPTVGSGLPCPPPNTVGNCSGCPDNKCDHYRYVATYPEGGDGSSVTYSGPFLSESNIDCPTTCTTAWHPDSVADRTSDQDYYVCHNAAAPARDGSSPTFPTDFSAGG